jgi:hypothetical protein
LQPPDLYFKGTQIKPMMDCEIQGGEENAALVAYDTT